MIYNDLQARRVPYYLLINVFKNHGGHQHTSYPLPSPGQLKFVRQTVARASGWKEH